MIARKSFEARVKFGLPASSRAKTITVEAELGPQLRLHNILSEIPFMSTIAKLSGVDLDVMVERGAFSKLAPMKIELIHGDLRFMNPAGPYHEDYIDFLNRWSCDVTDSSFCLVRVQSSFTCGDHRPEPDVIWIRPG